MISKMDFALLGVFLAAIPALASDLRAADFATFGTDAGHGNLVGVQPVMVEGDYRSEATFYRLMRRELQVAKLQGWLGPKSVVFFPEYFGTFLVAAGQDSSVYNASDFQGSMQKVALSDPFGLARALFYSQGQDRIRNALFRMKSASMAGILDRVSSRLAREFQVTLVPGSTLLVDAYVENGRLIAREQGPLYNTSVVYRSDGTADPHIVRKVNLTPDEESFVQHGKIEDYHAIQTPAGKLGLIICADSWYAETYQQLAKDHVDFLAVPSFLNGNGVAQEPWGGDGVPADHPDVGKITEHQAWIKHALEGKFPLSGAQNGLNVFLRGDLWGLGSDGLPMIVDHGAGKSIEEPAQPEQIVNLWL